MTALKIIAAVLLALFLLGRIRVGGAGEYAAGGFRAWVKIGPFSIQAFPMNKGKNPKAKKPKQEKPKEPKAEEKQGGPLETAKRYLPLACEAAGELKRRIRIDELSLDYTAAGGKDAAAAAMGFGYSNIAAGIILPLFEQNFEVKARRVRTAVDFTMESPKLYVYASVTARIGQLVSFAIRFGWKFLKAYRQTQNAKKEAN